MDEDEGVAELSMLTKIDPPPSPGARCSCPGVTVSWQTGQWAVKLNDEFHVFSPPTGLQKDIWLTAHSGITDDSDEAAYIKSIKIGALRWWCWNCGTVQEP